MLLYCVTRAKSNVQQHNQVAGTFAMQQRQFRDELYAIEFNECAVWVMGFEANIVCRK